MMSFKRGDRVSHPNYPGREGTVVNVGPAIAMLGGKPTAGVAWDDSRYLYSTYFQDILTLIPSPYTYTAVCTPPGEVVSVATTAI